MSNKETNTRLANAYRAMRVIGIKEDKAEDSKKAQATEEPERPLKRLRPRPQNGQPSSLNTSNASMPRTPLIRPKEELSETHPGKQPISSKSLVLYDHESGSPSQISIKRSQKSTQLSIGNGHMMKLRDRGAASLPLPSRGKKPVPKSSFHVVPLKDCKDERNILASSKKNKATHALIKPKDEPIIGKMQRSKEPDVIISTVASNGGYPLNQNCRLKENHRHEPRDNGELDVRISSECSSSLDIASSASGEVKISLSYNLAPGRPRIHVPTLATVLKSVEDKYLKASESLEPKNSMASLMSEICERFLTERPPTTNSLQDVVDIAKGHENVVITLVNEVNDEPPPSFYYIPQNSVFQNAYMNVSLARTVDDHCCSSCSGDCLLSSIPCACSYETGGEYAYTADGLVKEELLNESISMNRDPEKHCQYFCKECPLERSKRENIIDPCQGHLVRKFIKECWRKCGCNKQCGNRVVQRGITRKLQVFMTRRKGWGLRTLEDLPKGAFVCEYVGEVLTNAELFERVLSSPEGEKRSYPVLLDADWCAEGVLKDEEALCLDATYYGNVARFINHKCHDSNLVEIPVEVETPDHHYYHLAFFTTRKVKAMEELTWDYGIDFTDHEHPIKAFRCQCGSKFCRNKKRRSRCRRRW